ncbi:lipoprotein [Streptomyces fumigatiscleroticus]|nr:lipoprotein [Streptomyces fumigatiscleroticus]
MCGLGVIALSAAVWLLPHGISAAAGGNGAPARFTTARVGPGAGAGTPGTENADGRNVLTYRVQVEDRTGLDAEHEASTVRKVLEDPRGWTAGGTVVFVPTDSASADLTVRIATPATVDRLCGQAGLDTGGEVNCRVDNDVIVNLKRWTSGSPQFSGPIQEYRALIINHEVGHRLGRGHETCPRAGAPAPVMMQQIKGLKGCVANAWPYDADGRYLGGPAVP